MLGPQVNPTGRPLWLQGWTLVPRIKSFLYKPISQQLHNSPSWDPAVFAERYPRELARLHEPVEVVSAHRQEFAGIVDGHDAVNEDWVDDGGSKHFAVHGSIS